MVFAYLITEPNMSSTVAALPPPTHDIQHKREYDDDIDVPEYAFSELWQDRAEGITFGDVLDIINPLQHIPVVSTLYRMATEDEIGIGSRLIGGALFGGPLGILITGLTAIMEELSGGSVDEHVASLLNTIGDEDDAASQFASVEKRGPDPVFLPRLEVDVAAPAAPQAPATVDANPVAVSLRTADTTKTAELQKTDHPQLSPQPIPRAPVTVAPMTAIHRVRSRPAHTEQQYSGQLQPAMDSQGAQNQRIAKEIEKAQRAQAGLLLANLGAEFADRPRSEADQVTERQNQPFEAHPYLLPRGAPPQMISRAMEQALAKYQATLQQRSSAAPALAQ
jgi:hypothetical protein